MSKERSSDFLAGKTGIVGVGVEEAAGMEKPTTEDVGSVFRCVDDDEAPPPAPAAPAVVEEEEGEAKSEAHDFGAAGAAGLV